MSELSFRQIDAESWVRGNYREIAILRYSSDELAEKQDIVFDDGYEKELGKTKAAAFITSKGRQFALIAYQWNRAPYHKLVNILSLFNIDIDEMTTDLEDILEVLDFGTEDLIWIEPTISFQKYEVWRQDDHGNRFLVEIAASRADAKIILRKYELIPHKQTYWLERHKG
jgi:hypothetical protein